MKKIFPLLIIVAITIILIEVVFIIGKSNFLTKESHDANYYAQKIVKECSISNYKPTCYDEELPKLMDFLSMEEVFEVTRQVQNLDSSYAYCHTLGHDLSAIEVRKDPDRWMDVATRCPSGLCSNGCIHGGFQERFRKEHFSTDEEIQSVKPDLKILCEKRDGWSPTGLEQASCYHALGHLTMYITNADINKSLNLCDEVALKEGGRDFRQLCYDGAFMQIFQPLEPDDFTLIEGKEVNKAQHESFCNKFDGQRKGSCRSEGWPLYREELLKSADFLVSFCGRGDDKEKERCINSIIYVIAAQLGLDDNKITKYCSTFSSSTAGQCFANSASRMIEVDYRNINKAVALCGRAQSLNLGSTCYDELVKYSDYNFRYESEEFFSLCNSLPGDWKDKCLKNTD